MTTPPAEQGFDLGNRYLSEVPSELTTTKVRTPQGQRLAVTLRTTSATVTVFIDRATVRAWSDHLSTEHGGMTDLILPGQDPG